MHGVVDEHVGELVERLEADSERILLELALSAHLGRVGRVAGDLVDVADGGGGLGSGGQIAGAGWSEGAREQDEEHAEHATLRKREILHPVV